MRLLTLLLVVVLCASCSEPKPKAESVRKYCQLTTMPHANAKDLRAIDKRAIELFAEKKPYKTTDANRRVIAAATAISGTARALAIELEQPGLFRGGTTNGESFKAVHGELVAACAALPRDKPK